MYTWRVWWTIWWARWWTTWWTTITTWFATLFFFFFAFFFLLCFFFLFLLFFCFLLLLCFFFRIGRFHFFNTHNVSTPKPPLYALHQCKWINPFSYHNQMAFSLIYIHRRNTCVVWLDTKSLNTFEFMIKGENFKVKSLFKQTKMKNVSRLKKITPSVHFLLLCWVFRKSIWLICKTKLYYINLIYWIKKLNSQKQYKKYYKLQIFTY